MWIVLTIIATYLFWTIGHELSHLLAAKLLVGLKKWSIYPYPHIVKDEKGRRFYFARTSMTYAKTPSEEERQMIFFAPRLLDYLMLWGCFIFAFYASPYLGIFLFGGVIDLFVGSLGISKHSDLKKSTTNALDLWLNRMMGLTVSICCGVGIFSYFMYYIS